MDKSDLEIEAEIDALFREARHLEPTPSEALMARILADAETVQRATEAPRDGVLRLRPWRARMRQLGGVPAAAALAASVLFGLGAGYSLPDTSSLWSLIGGSESFDYLAPDGLALYAMGG